MNEVHESHFSNTSSREPQTCESSMQVVSNTYKLSEFIGLQSFHFIIFVVTKNLFLSVMLCDINYMFRLQFLLFVLQ